jgi:uncharacterized protein (DUF1778 family)
MARPTQLSAFVSPSTRERLERYSRATGVKKGHLIEEALLHHLQALDEIPAEYVIHPRIVLSRASAEEVMERLRDPKAPTQALRDLMAADGD